MISFAVEPKSNRLFSRLEFDRAIIHNAMTFSPIPQSVKVKQFTREKEESTQKLYSSIHNEMF